MVDIDEKIECGARMNCTPWKTKETRAAVSRMVINHKVWMIKKSAEMRLEDNIASNQAERVK